MARSVAGAIDAFGNKEADKIVLWILIGDGNPEKQNIRHYIFNPEFKFVGVKTGPSSCFGTRTTINFADEFISNGHVPLEEEYKPPTAGECGAETIHMRDNIGSVKYVLPVGLSNGTVTWDLTQNNYVYSYYPFFKVEDLSVR